MDEQGSSRLPVDEHGSISNRLAGMDKIIVPELEALALASNDPMNGVAVILHAVSNDTF